MIKNPEIIKKKLELFLKNKIKVHIMKEDKTFLNGYVKKKIDNDVYEFLDSKFGIQHLILDEIFAVSTFNDDKGDSNT